MFNLPLSTMTEIINVVTQEAEMDMYVLTIALIFPSPWAVAELNEGLNCKLKQMF